MAELEAATAGPIASRGDDDLAALLYTGGTTGRAKGVMLSHANLHYTGAAAHASAYVPGVNRGLGTLPLSHAYGILVTISGCTTPSGASPCCCAGLTPPPSARWSPSTACRSRLSCPRCCRSCSASHWRNTTSRRSSVTSGGAPLPPEVAAEFCRRVPSVTIRQGYGLTETGALISSNPVGRERAGSVGHPRARCEVVIVDDEGRPVPDGEPGEITAAPRG